VDVNLVFSFAESESYVSGSGRYEVHSGVGPLTVIGQRMVLDLRVGDVETYRRYDSGVVPLNGAFDLEFFDVTLRAPATTPGGGATIRLKVRVVPEEQIARYTVDARQSAYLEGCYDPCDCALSMHPVGGEFGLVALSPATTPALQEWAVVRVRFDVLAPTPVWRPWRGVGIYRRAAALPTPGPAQRLRATLRREGLSSAEGPVRFDSGWVGIAAPWPMIDIAIADHGFVCYNRVFDFVARPR
jgi:hypothetical protein